jgi:hypothetical protein
MEGGWLSQNRRLLASPKSRVLRRETERGSINVAVEISVLSEQSSNTQNAGVFLTAGEWRAATMVFAKFHSPETSLNASEASFDRLQNLFRSRRSAVAAWAQ